MPSPFKLIKEGLELGEKATGKVAKKAAKTVAEKAKPAETKVIPEAVGGIKPEEVKTTPKTGRVSATDLSLRGMKQPEAIEKAKTEKHLTVIDPKTDRIVGAPERLGPASGDWRGNLDNIRKEFDAAFARGAGSSDWYRRVHEFVTTYAGPDPKAQEELAANLGLFSPRANPDVNLGRSVMARNAKIMDEPLTGGAFPDQLKKYNEQFAQHGGAVIPEGLKVAPYSTFLSPTLHDPTTAVNDAWHSTNLGFRMRPDEVNPKPENIGSTQHTFLDYETMLGVDRANEAGVKGRSDWTGGEVQAGAWVDAKARDLMERLGWSKEKAYEEAHKSYLEYAPKYEFQATHEAVPGKTSGHLPEFATGSQADRDYFSDLPGSTWRDPESGRDTIYSSMGAYTGKTKPMVGRFEGEPNKGEIATPLVSFVDDPSGSGSRVMADPSQKMVQGGEAFRGYMDAQDAAAGSIPTAPGSVAGQTGYELGGVPFSAESMNWLGGLRGNLADVIHYGGDRGMLTSFGDRGKENFGAKGMEGILADIQARYPEATAKPVASSSTYTPYHPTDTDYAWGGGAKPGETPIQGTDMATLKMLDQLTPAHIQRLDTDAVRASVKAKYDRDAQLAADGKGTVRADIQQARKLFADGGFEALKKAIGTGVLPAAGVGALLSEFEQPTGTGAQPGGGQL